MINTFEIEGKFNRIDTRDGKGGKVFLTLVLDVEGNYPQIVPFRLWGRTVEEAKDWRPGDVLRIKGKLGGREWNGKVFGDNSADSVEVVSKGKQEASPPPADDGSDTPF